MATMENKPTLRTTEDKIPSGKPVLTPLRTDHRSSPGQPKVPMLSPSPVHRSALPSPMYSSTLRNEPRTPYEQAMIQSLDHRANLSSPSTPVTLTAIMEHFSELSIQVRSGLPSPPRSPRTPIRERRYLVQRSRSRSCYSNAEIYHVSRRYSHPVVRRRIPARPEPLRRSQALASPSQLRHWGQVYFGHLKSADAFIIPKSLAVKQEEDVSPSHGTSTLQAVIVPRAEKAHAFVLKEDEQGTFSAEPTPFRLDYETLHRQRRPFPIHLMYALHHLPLLAGFLESGPVHRGDIVYLPVPHASAWVRTLRYIYTGEGELTEKMRRNILFLGGRI